MEKDIEKKIDKVWSNQKYRQKSRWWQFPTIYRHINELICGRPLNGASRGLIEQLKKLGITFDHGVSVGFGDGTKEFVLIEEGLVNNFTLFELSKERIEIAKDKADSLGLNECVKFIHSDYLKYNFSENVDFVHWNNSLHHMMDVEQAIKWSFDILINGGVFYMDDYVGASRFQWSDKEIQLSTKIRNILPDRYLKDPKDPSKLINKTLVQPDKKIIEQGDPSEAADSDRILGCITKYFPDAEIHLTGGVIYHGAMTDILYNFDESDETDNAILKLLLIIDELSTKSENETQYATALAIKNDNVFKSIKRKFY